MNEQSCSKTSSGQDCSKSSNTKNCDESIHVHQCGELDAWLGLIFLGLALLIGSFLANFLFEENFYGMLCSISAAICLGAPLIVRTYNDLKSGCMHMDELAAIAVVACFALEDYQTSALVSFFMLLANFIESSRAKGAYEAIESLVKLTPKKAQIKEGDSLKEIDVNDLSIEQTIFVSPGDYIPVDGEIINGQTTINESSITGESFHVEKSQGDNIYAGTLNLTGGIEVKVLKLGQDTTIGKVKNLILDASQTKIPVMKIIDKYVYWYTPVVLMLCGIILFFTRDMYIAITTLVVMCPCAFILATPTAIVAALSSAAKSGVFVKNATDLENAANISAVVFDKTGTLTTGQLEVSRIEPHEQEALNLLTLSASLAKNSKHPASKAVSLAAKKAKIKLTTTSDFQETHGKGVQGQIDDNTILMGRKTWLQENNIHIPESEEEIDASLLYVSKGNQYIGRILLKDKMRGEAKKALDELREQKVTQLTMLTGDRLEVAQKVAADLAIKDFHAGCLPEHKLETVNKLKQKDFTVAVIGDGVNDGPALAAGDISIAMGALGTDVAIHSASITFMNSDLRRLPYLITLSKATRRVIYQNFLFGFLFIIIGTILAIFKVMSPIWAAIMHNLGSFLVIFNSFRLVHIGNEDE